MPDTQKLAPNGWILLDKPRGLGSTQAVGAVKRNLREAGYPKVKVGHGGTLDPLAEGVLPIALGEATKLAGRMLEASKIYEFTIQFGEETETLDSEGEVVHTSDRRPPMAAIPTVLEHFTGPIEQVPPKYSALMVDGKRAYERARAGEEVEMKTRAVTIHSLTLGAGDDTGAEQPSPANTLWANTPPNDHGRGAPPPDPQRSQDELRNPIPHASAEVGSTFATSTGRPDLYDPGMPLELADAITLTAHVSKGTYIRSLARDIALALGTYGHVTHLRRTRAGSFDQSQAISLDKLNAIGKGAPLKDIILPLEAGLDGIPALSLTSEQAGAIRQGRVLDGLPQPDGLYLSSHGNVPVALVELIGGTTKIVRGFNFPDTAE